MDSLCPNCKQIAIVFMDLDNFRFNLCAQMVYVNSLDYAFVRNLNNSVNICISVFALIFIDKGTVIERDLLIDGQLVSKL